MQSAVTIEIKGRFNREGGERYWRLISREQKAIFHKEDEIPLGLYERKLEEVGLQALRDNPDAEAISAKAGYVARPLVHHKAVIDEHRIQIEYWAERAGTGTDPET